MLAHKAPFKDPPFLWANSSSILGSLKWFPKSSPWILKNTGRNWVIHDDWWPLDNHGLIEYDRIRPVMLWYACWNQSCWGWFWRIFTVVIIFHIYIYIGLLNIIYIITMIIHYKSSIYRLIFHYKPSSHWGNWGNPICGTPPYMIIYPRQNSRIIMETYHDSCKNG